MFRKAIPEIFVVKIGGSIFDNIEEIAKKLRRFCSFVKIVLFPGGWEGADLIRKYRKRWRLRNLTTHKMALSVLDLNAYIISEIFSCKVASNIEELKKIIYRHKICTLLPSRILSCRRYLKKYNLNIDVFSSDSSACLIASLLKAGLILIKDVDGIYSSDPKMDKKAQLYRYISAKKLQEKTTCIDITLPKLIYKYRVKTWIINGRYPSRILDVIFGKRFIGTFIEP